MKSLGKEQSYIKIIGFVPFCPSMNSFLKTNNVPINSLRLNLLELFQNDLFDFSKDIIWSRHVDGPHKFFPLCLVVDLLHRNIVFLRPGHRNPRVQVVQL